MEGLERDSSKINSSLVFISLFDSVRKPFMCVHTFGLGVAP